MPTSSREDFVNGLLRLSKLDFNPTVVTAPVTDRKKEIKNLPPFHASDLSGQWSDRCHVDLALVTSFEVRQGTFYFKNGRKILEEWGLNEPEINGREIRLSIGVFDTAKITFKQIGRRTLKVVSHDIVFEGEYSRYSVDRSYNLAYPVITHTHYM